MREHPVPRLSAGQQAWLLQRLRWRRWRHSTWQMLRQAPIRPLTIALCSALIWITLFLGSYWGFRELVTRWHVPIDYLVGGFVLDLMFSALTLLLLFSSGIILYSSLFASAETAFLLVTPLEADQVFAYHFQSALAFSSWAFVLLASPVLLAYGLVVGGGAPWYYFALLPIFFLGFVLVPGSLGALACLLLVRWLPRRRRQVAWLGLLGGLGAAGVWLYRVLAPHLDRLFLDRNAVNEIFRGFALLRHASLPSHWIGEGLRCAAVGEWQDALYYLTLLWANGLFLYLLAAMLARRLYREDYNRLASGSTLRRRYGGRWLDSSLVRLLAFLPGQTRLLIIKDFRTFRRDPAQWAQILIFLGLFFLYASSLRYFYAQDLTGKPFQNGISLLNLVATCFLACAYTGRFIFPLLSLEGRKFWILGLLPLERDRLLWGKFVFAALGTLLATEILILFSNLMLAMPAEIVLAHVLTVALVSLGLSGLSVGLGACLPNFRESDPSKIAVGFGGTLNLVASLLFLVSEVALVALPLHLLLAVRGGQNLSLSSQDWWLGLGALLGLLLAGAAVWLPLRAGCRALRRMEF
jgi:ABC-2 type transport system permease protein